MVDREINEIPYQIKSRYNTNRVINDVIYDKNTKNVVKINIYFLFFIYSAVYFR